MPYVKGNFVIYTNKPHFASYILEDATSDCTELVFSLILKTHLAKVALLILLIDANSSVTSNSSLIPQINNRTVAETSQFIKRQGKKLKISCLVFN